jgi:hypothetical protein
VGTSIQSGKPEGSTRTGETEQGSARGRWDDGGRIARPSEGSLDKHTNETGNRDVSTESSETGRNTEARRRTKKARHPDDAFILHLIQGVWGFLGKITRDFLEYNILREEIRVNCW